MQLLCHGSEITTFLNEFNQSLEGKKNLIVVACEGKNFRSHQEISSSNGKEIRPKSVRHHVRAVRTE